MKGNKQSESRFHVRETRVSMQTVSRPRLSGKVVASADGRGKLEQKRKKDSDVCTHPCPYRLALLGTSLRIRGKPTTKEKRIHSF